MKAHEHQKANSCSDTFIICKLVVLTLENISPPQVHKSREAENF